MCTGQYDNPSSIKSAESERRGSQYEQAYQISCNRQVPNYRKFLKGSRNKASVAEYISNYIIEHVAEYLLHDTLVVLAGDFSEVRFHIRRSELGKSVLQPGGSGHSDDPSAAW